jgi:hypothetical protein
MNKRSLVLSMTLAGALSALGCAGAGAANKATEGFKNKEDYEVVDCLLPPDVRQLGHAHYLSARRPIRTAARDCQIRGGEYVSYSRSDYKTALNVWMEQAKAGDIEAETNVGEIYERGLGGEPNYEAAIIWYQKVIDTKGVADEKKSRALFNMGTLYEQGKGVDKDPLMALNLYRRSWGLPENNIMYTSAKDREVGALREQLEKAVADKDQQIDLMKKQIEELRKKSSADASTMQQLLDRIVAERADNQKRLAAIPAVVSHIPDPAQVRTPLSSLSITATQSSGSEVIYNKMNFGRYYALIVGNQNYDKLESLTTPHYDAERAKNILTKQYGFTVTLIEDGNDVAIVEALNNLRLLLKPNDNLLIYYAGHGYRLKSELAEIGYWLPRNAGQPPNDTFWVPNEQITRQISLLPAKRVLVVADSCFAGLLSSDPNFLFLGKATEVDEDYLQFKLPSKSRLLIASGGDNPVLDQGGNGNSVFAKAFLDVLESNTSIMTAPGLFTKVQGLVKEGAARNHFSEEPEIKSIKNAGHEVGDFFFVPVARTKT